MVSFAVSFRSSPEKRLTAEEVIHWVDENPTEANIADAFETAHCAFVYFEDETYDYDRYSQNWAYYTWNANQWHSVIQHTEGMILDILRKESIAGVANHAPDDVDSYHAIQQFMERNGYREGSGWWIPIKDDNGNSLAIQSLQMKSYKL